MTKRWLIVLALMIGLSAGCYPAQFPEATDTEMVERFIEIYIDYPDTKETFHETYSCGYNAKGQLLEIMYLFDGTEDPQWEKVTVVRDENGNPKDFEGEITGDWEFMQYILSIFTQEKIHEIENNDLPLQIDLSRLVPRLEKECSVHSQYAFHSQIENIREIRLETYYDHSMTESLYTKKVRRVEAEQIIEELYNWKNNTWVRSE